MRCARLREVLARALRAVAGRLDPSKAYEMRVRIRSRIEWGDEASPRPSTATCRIEGPVRDDWPGRISRLDGPSSPLEFEVPVGPDAREAFGEDCSKGGLRIALAQATERACAGYDVVVDRRVSSLHRERWPEAWRVAWRPRQAARTAKVTVAATTETDRYVAAAALGLGRTG